MWRNAPAIVSLLFTCAVLAGEPPKPADAPAPKPEANPISEALCGREAGESVRAKALDADDAIPPTAWRRATVEDLAQWLRAPRCVNGKIAEYALFTRRRRTLQTLRSRVDRAIVVGRFEDALADFPRWSQRESEWPTAEECGGCDVLRRAAAGGAKIRSEWPKRISQNRSIGVWLDGEETRESLIRDLCAVMPPPQAGEEMANRFRYYTWTARGATLMEIARWFERPDVLAECRGPHP